MNNGNGECVASSLKNDDYRPCAEGRCSECLTATKVRFSTDPKGRPIIILPLSDSGERYGVLLLCMQTESRLETAQVLLLETLSRHIGAAIGAERRNEQKRKLALLEERAIIARELHDSLAQSLAYMKIQVSRLQQAIKDSRRIVEVDNTLKDLREGLTGSYRQLRELLSTFRLKMDTDNFLTSVEQTIVEFSERGNIPIDLQHSFTLCTLLPNEEIHVLHIIREALANILNHASAKHAWVNICCNPEGMFEVVIEDDGIGISKAAGVHHYGMIIMEERAKSLRGSCEYDSHPAIGTRVSLKFRPASRHFTPKAMKQKQNE